MNDNKKNEKQQDLLSEFIIENGTFLCNICKEFLSLPVMLVENVGHICGICYDSNYKSAPNQVSILRNKMVETILLKLELPCKFKDHGCDLILPYNERKNHEIECLNRQQKCPIISLEDENGKELCDWEGSLKLLEKHLIDKHGELVIKSESNSFTVEVDVSEMKEWGLNGNYKLIVMRQYAFFLKLSFDSNEDSGNLRHTLCRMFQAKELTAYNIKYQGDANKDHFMASKDSLLKPLPFMFDCSNEPEKMNLNVLQQISEFKEKIQIFFTIDTSQLKMKILYKQDTQHFECPICLEVMRAPIYLCVVGHSICGTCKAKIQNCPICKSNLSDTRNFDLEKLLSTKRVNCSTQLESEADLKTSNVVKITDDHGDYCLLRPTVRWNKCPVGNCKVIGKQEFVIQHMIEEHPDQVVNNENHSYYKVHINNKYASSFLISHNEILLISYQANPYFSFNTRIMIAIIHFIFESGSLKYKVSLNITSDKDYKSQELSLSEDHFSDVLSYGINLISKFKIVSINNI